jgi:phosphatidylglycerol---prolipoprotein diacylglyceryl transferase
MRRVLVQWGPVSLRSYPTLLAVGLVLGLYAQLVAAAASGLDLARSQAATLLLSAVALGGSRLLYALARPRGAAGGGAVLYGGLLLALPVSVPLLAALGLGLGAYWDAACFTLMVGVGFGRVGCYLHGCCAGRPTAGWRRLGAADARGTWRIPVQLLEAAWVAAVLAAALLLRSRSPFPGALCLGALGAYGAGRLALEPAREPAGRVLGSTFHRGVSAALVAAALLGLSLGRGGA